MTQDQALEILKTGANVFLTGEPGSGKTYLINRYVTYLKQHQITVAITASTGIAATHLHGQTIHSWSGIGILKQLNQVDKARLRSKSRLVSRAKKTQVLIIDEISMLDAATITAIDQALQVLAERDQPFGGLQVVFVGDFFQLPPVNNQGETTNFAFHSPVWQQAKPVVCYLTEQHRQQDTQLTSLLQAMRQGKQIEDHYQLLLTRQVTLKLKAEATQLYSHNINVDQLNQQKLDTLGGEVKHYQMDSHGRRSLVEQLKKGCLSPETLSLKAGAQVMFTKNDFEQGFVNGTLGEVINFDEGLPIVRTKKGKVILVTPAEWLVEDDGKTLASISQLPLRLAWAITIHKSQGMTLDTAIIDLSSTFEYGQGYVAISRVRSLSGLHLLGLNQLALQVHPDIILADADFHQQSAKAIMALNHYSTTQMQAKQRHFIIHCGGNLKPVDLQVPKTKTSTYNQTLILYQQGMSLDQIAQSRGFKPRTIVSHFEKLKQEGRLTNTQLKRIVPAYLTPNLAQIHHAFVQQKDNKLSPIHQHFNGQYTYHELSLARLVME